MAAYISEQVTVFHRFDMCCPLLSQPQAAPPGGHRPAPHRHGHSDPQGPAGPPAGRGAGAGAAQDAVGGGAGAVRVAAQRERQLPASRAAPGRAARQPRRTGHERRRIAPAGGGGSRQGACHRLTRRRDMSSSPERAASLCGAGDAVAGTASSVPGTAMQKQPLAA